MQLRNWLKQMPGLHKVRGIEADGETFRTVRINDSKSRWRDAERSLEGCIQCDGLNADGEILGTWKDEEATPETRATRTLAGNRSDHNLTIVELARVITESNRDAVNLHADAYRMGWETLLQIVKFQGDRLQALERAWHRVVMGTQKEGEDAPTLDNNTQMILALLGPALAGMLGGNGGTPPQQPPPKKTPNGAP